MMGQFARYERYKPSGVEWLGDIPEHWDLQPIRTIFQERKEKNTGPKTDFILSVMKDRGIIPYDEKGNVGNKKSENIENYKVVYPGDLVINKMNAIIGSLGISPYHGALSQVYFVLYPRNKKITDFSFFGYFFQIKSFQKSLIKIARGIMELRESIEFNEFKKLPLTLPPIEEQKRIVKFLDRTTSDIDRAIAKKQRLIKLLEEQKTILINQAVTKGLDPNVPMKDSGINWIDTIPQHWEVKKLKYLFKEVDDRSKNGSETLFSLRMVEGLVPHNDVSDKLIADKELIGYKRVQKGQIVMNRMRAAIGLFGLVKEFGLVSPDYAIFDSIEQLNQGYFLNLFKTNYLKDIFRLESKGLGTGSSGFLRLYSDRFGMIKVPFPTPEEQTEIVNYIQLISKNILDASQKIIEQIEKLKEIKSILISEAVTGKIKV